MANNTSWSVPRQFNLLAKTKKFLSKDYLDDPSSCVNAVGARHQILGDSWHCLLQVRHLFPLSPSLRSLLAQFGQVVWLMFDLFIGFMNSIPTPDDRISFFAILVLFRSLSFSLVSLRSLPIASTCPSGRHSELLGLLNPRSFAKSSWSGRTVPAIS